MSSPKPQTPQEKQASDNVLVMQNADAGKTLAMLLPVAAEKLSHLDEGGLNRLDGTLRTIRLGMQQKKIAPVDAEGKAMAVTLKDVDSGLAAIDRALRPNKWQRVCERAYVFSMVAGFAATCFAAASMLFVYGAVGLLAVSAACVYYGQKLSPFDAQGKRKAETAQDVKDKPSRAAALWRQCTAGLASTLARVKNCKQAFNTSAKAAVKRLPTLPKFKRKTPQAPAPKD